MKTERGFMVVDSAGVPVIVAVRETEKKAWVCAIMEVNRRVDVNTIDKDKKALIAKGYRMAVCTAALRVEHLIDDAIPTAEQDFFTPEPRP